MTALHLAAIRGDAALVSALLTANAEMEAAQTANGSTPLLAACHGPAGLPALRLLLEAGATGFAACKGTRTTGLMLLADWQTPGEGEDGGDVAAAEAASLLLQHGADPSAVDAFGQTALHRACRKGTPELIAALCEGGARPDAQDNDGTYPLQLLCQRCVEQVEEEQRLVSAALPALFAAEPQAARMLDFGDASPLHTVCHYLFLRAKGTPARPPRLLLRALLAAGADMAQEEERGWTAAHFLANAPEGPEGAACQEALRALRAEAVVKQGFWESFDPAKPRGSSNTKYLARRGGHHRIPEPERFEVMRGDVSLAGVAARLREGRSRRVVVLLGAGASTAAGIPDFRSPGGLWTTEATRELFSGPGFFSQPEAFWRKSFELFEGKRPTKVHALLAQLHSRGLLVRAYTQNIDNLEEAAGLPREKVVECHGSVRRAVCCEDSRHPSVPVQDIAAEARQADSSGAVWRATQCSVCGGLMRPDVVFFGEPLPESYHRHWAEDFGSCDLLIVIGTSLLVYPVAGLVKQVGPLCPRLLLQRERAGHWRERSSENYRDPFWEGECDAGAEELARELGWDLA